MNTVGAAREALHDLLVAYRNERNPGKVAALYSALMQREAAIRAESAETLRALLDRFERTLPQYVDMDGLHWWPCADIRAALAATPAEDEEGET